MKIAIDWDNTLVDHQGEWLEGAERAFRKLLIDHEVVIHSCRANWPQGVQSIEDKIRPIVRNRKVQIVGKPVADLYIDDRSLPFNGDWPSLTREVSKLNRLPKP